MHDIIEEVEPGTLKEGEPHPSAIPAFVWLKEYIYNHPMDWAMVKEAIASTALSDNRTSEILFSTIDRLENGKPISDRYLLGLAWFVRNQPELHAEKSATTN